MIELTEEEKHYFDVFFEHFDDLPINVKLSVIAKFKEIDKLSDDRMIIFVSMN